MYYFAGYIAQSSKPQSATAVKKALHEEKTAEL